MEPDEMNEIQNEIKLAKETVMVEKKIIYFQDDRIRFAIANVGKYDELMSWIKANDYRKGLLGAPLNFDETSRISGNKISAKSKQIPKDSAGIIYIPVQPLYFSALDVESAIKIIQNQLSNFHNIFGVVIYASICDSSVPCHEILNNHIYAVKKMNKAVSRYLFFVKNDKFNISLSNDTVEKIYKSFE